ncbi:patatin-like phospholipase family protein [Methylobacterium sp. PvR107]|uniref:patatin-like phospholipase family protein n=1 Tax=Methylobacterium sp. PvR107 TaxID=2806597 RepID=UPI001AE46F0E|nr:patatin-like phospholipase family protein [Methylobacterium sp. PvR107]MBP1182180.1 patatin-like phospholipase/acyl hydrolase [Methylobacterium sp. PvR107]
MSHRIILTIDGGGVRGIVPALVLSEIYRRIKKIDPENIRGLHEYFDLVVGTSAGAIVASAITTPNGPDSNEAVMHPDHVVDFFREHVRSIFPRTLFQKIRDVLNIIDEKYDHGYLDEILKRTLRTATIGEALTNVVYTAYDIETRKPVFMTNIDDEKNTTSRMLVKDVVRASTAAPTYFAPARILHDDQKSYRTLIDGGVFMNDPALAGLHFSNTLGYPLEDLTIISLGTGRESRPYMYHEVKNWGFVNWVSPRRGVPLLSILSSGQAESTYMMLNQTLNRPGGTRRYIKIDGQLAIGNDDLDDSSEENMAELEVFARMLVDRHDSQIDEIANLLYRKLNPEHVLPERALPIEGNAE